MPNYDVNNKCHSTKKLPKTKLYQSPLLISISYLPSFIFTWEFKYQRKEILEVFLKNSLLMINFQSSSIAKHKVIKGILKEEFQKLEGNYNHCNFPYKIMTALRRKHGNEYSIIVIEHKITTNLLSATIHQNSREESEYSLQVFITKHPIYIYTSYRI